MVLLVILLADVDEIIKHKRKNLKNYKGAGTVKNPTG